MLERLALSDFDLRGVTAARVRACVFVGYHIKSNRVSNHTAPIYRLQYLHKSNRVM